MKLSNYALMLWLSSIPVAVAAERIPPADVVALQAAADRGDADARFQLGRACLRGEGVPKDTKKAFELMQAAAAQGHADAMGGVGYFYSKGIAVAKDEGQAAEWFRQGAEKGSAKAQLNLGKIQLLGKNVDSKEKDPDVETALQWIQKAADQGLSEACYTYGRILFHGDYGQPQDYAKALVYLKPAAEHGIPDVQNMLGSMYENGSGTPTDVAVAQQWYRKAALQGHARAQGNLGMCLGPIAQDKETRIEALAWLLMAADQNQVFAEKALADAAPKPGDLKLARKKQAELEKLIKK